MPTENVYIGHDNTIDLILKSDGIAVSTTGITKITLQVADELVSSTNQATDAIRWNQSGYKTGEIRLQLGHQDIDAGRYPRCYLTIYDVVNTDGIVWGALQLFVLADVEATD